MTNQDYYWTEEWQEGEREADKNIVDGSLSEVFYTSQDAINYLHSIKDSSWHKNKD